MSNMNMDVPCLAENGLCKEAANQVTKFQRGKIISRQVNPQYLPAETAIHGKALDPVSNEMVNIGAYIKSL